MELECPYFETVGMHYWLLCSAVVVMHCIIFFFRLLPRTQRGESRTRRARSIFRNYPRYLFDLQSERRRTEEKSCHKPRERGKAIKKFPI